MASQTPFGRHKAGTGIANVRPSRLMVVDEMVDAALAGPDRGEIVTIPSLQEVADWEAFTAARVSWDRTYPSIMQRPVTAAGGWGALRATTRAVREQMEVDEAPPNFTIRQETRHL